MKNSHSNWIEDIKNNPPPNNVIVECLGDWVGGDYVFKAKRKDYKEGCSKSQRKRGWRWVSVNNEVITRKNQPFAWRYIKGEP